MMILRIEGVEIAQTRGGCCFTWQKDESVMGQVQIWALKTNLVRLKYQDNGKQYSILYCFSSSINPLEWSGVSRPACMMTKLAESRKT